MANWYSKKIWLLFLCVAVVVLTSLLTVLSDKRERSYRPGINPEEDRAVNQAMTIFMTAKKAGVDLSMGPCLTNSLLSGWVLDLVHSPRQAMDDLPDNQCRSFLEGQAKHFVELDLDSNVVRVK